MTMARPPSPPLRMGGARSYLCLGSTTTTSQMTAEGMNTPRPRAAANGAHLFAQESCRRSEIFAPITVHIHPPTLALGQTRRDPGTYVVHGCHKRPGFAAATE